MVRDRSRKTECIRSVPEDGLVQASSKLVLVGMALKTSNQCVVEDDKVGTDMLGGGADHCFCRVCTVYGPGCIQQDLKSTVDQCPEINV